MLDQLLPYLRCPFDPHRRTPLLRSDDALQCPACSARFRIRNGIPVLVPQDAILPVGIRHHAQLAARHSSPLAFSDTNPL
ncbi:MAG: hypothetical protein RMJ88_09285 [Thermogemmata sp.]|nr:hypothetical protein [Thermogemmata sp.]